MDTKDILPRITAARARDICRHYRVKSELEPLLADDPSPLAFLDRLLFQERHLTDAIDFLAHGLPKREAVWWGCLCLQSTWNVAALHTEHHLALRAAVRWALEPKEELRRAAEQPGNQVGVGMPSGCLALAVFESGESIQPADQPIVSPHPQATAQGVRNALHLLAAKLPATQVQSAYRQFVALGIGLAGARPSRGEEIHGP
jgi:hypothetical protein